MNLSGQNVVIRASAGSGKTFQLTNRYLTLIFDGVPPQTILATTFTRKAAGEILDRILARLASAALSDDACARLSGELYSDSGVLKRSDVLKRLAELASTLHQLRISTLDSFFSGLAGIFSLEMGLPIGWRIVDDAVDGRYLNRAILAAFSDPKRNDISRILHLLFKGEISRSLSREVNDLVIELIDLYRQTEQGDWSKLPKFSGLSESEFQEAFRLIQTTPVPTNKDGKAPNLPFQKGRNILVGQITDELWNAVCASSLFQNVLNGNDFYYKKEIPSDMKRGIEMMTRHLRALLLNQIGEQTTATWDVLARIAGYYDEIKTDEGGFRFEDLTRFLAKKSRQTELDQVSHRLDSRTDHLLLDEFQDTSLFQWQVLRPLAEFVTTAVTNSVTSPSDGGGLAGTPSGGGTGETISDVTSLPPMTTRSRNTETVFSRADLRPIPVMKTSALSDGGQNSDRREESTGGDEKEGASNGKKSFFCVGDVKQAIYRWRGGTAEIFDAIEKSLPVRLDHLDCNWRSSPVIIEAVNALFCQIASNPIFQPNEKKEVGAYEKRRVAAFLTAAQTWESRFDRHDTASANKGVPGQVSLESAPLYDPDAPDDQSIWGMDDEDDFTTEEITTGGSAAAVQKRVTLTYAIHRIAEIHRRAPGASIGVLLRTNRLIGKIIAGLARLGIEASQEGGVPLTSSKSVQAILSILTLADHPGDSVVNFHLASLDPLADYFGISYENESIPAVGRRLSLLIRRRIMTVGLGRFVWEMSKLLFPLCDEQETSTLESLTERAFQFESENELRLDRFIETVEKTKLEIPSASHIHIMTIHRSKGLEFDVVVLPELDETIISSREKVTVHRPAPIESVDTVLRRVSREVQPLLPPLFQTAIEEEWTAQTEESLNILYVAVTRAVHELVMIVSPKKTEIYEGKSFANILRGCFASDDPEGAFSTETPLETTGGKILYRNGDPDWFQKTKHATGVSTVESDSFPPRLLSAETTTSFVSAPSPLPPSRKDFRRAWHSPSRFTRGSVIHHCFEKVDWLDDRIPDRAELRRSLLPKFFDERLIDEAMDEFFIICNQPRTKILLTRTTYQMGNQTPVHAGGVTDPSWEVFTERAFLLPRGKTADWRGNRDGVIRGTIDRLVLLRSGGKIVGADIIDFKTDRGFPFDETSSEISEELRGRIDPYFHQLAEYRRIAAKFFSLPVSAISARLAFVSSDVIVDVPVLK